MNFIDFVDCSIHISIIVLKTVHRETSMRFVKYLAIIAVVGLIACSSAERSTGDRPNRSTNVLNEEEILQANSSNVYDLVSKLRPKWLYGRGTKSFLSPEASVPIVYVNGVRHGTVETLYNLHVADISQIRYLSASEATTRYGLDHTSGAILITYSR